MEELEYTPLYGNYRTLVNQAIIALNRQKYLRREWMLLDEKTIIDTAGQFVMSATTAIKLAEEFNDARIRS